MIFFGGLSSAQAYIEVRHSYIYGLYLSTVLLALACIEQELAGILYGRGSENAANARLEKLLKDSLESKIINEEEFKTFDHLREIRNSYTHFRSPTHQAAWARRAMTTETPVDDILEGDAIAALSALGSYLDRSAQIYVNDTEPFASR